MQKVFNVQTSGPGVYEFTGEVVRFVRDSGLREGLLTLFVQHTSCSLLVRRTRIRTCGGISMSSSGGWSLLRRSVDAVAPAHQ